MMHAIKGQVTLKDHQMQQIRQMTGNTRFVWNALLAMRNERYKNNPSLTSLSEYDMNNLLPTFKREYPFLKESDSTSLQQVSGELMQGFKNFWKNPSHFKYPRFKSKQHPRQSYTSKNVNGSIRVDGNYLRLPKLGWVQFRSGRDVTGKIKRATVSITASGMIECSLLIEDKSQVLLEKTHRTVGIDMGVADLMVLSTGDRVKTIRFDKALEPQRHYWETRVARRGLKAKKNGTPLSEAKNYQRAKQQRARLYRKEKNQRQDRLHKLTTQLVNDFDVIVLEDLSTVKMMKDRQLARSIAAQSWREIRQMLEYKCAMYGKELRVVNPYKTSQICSDCGHDDGKHALNIREWTCPTCHTVHDRDINAAKNILAIGSGRALVTTA